MTMLATVLALASCGVDNYDKPTCRFSGRVVYNGQPLGVSGINRLNFLQFWQNGYELFTAINCFVTQDGSYSALLHSGTYKFVMNNNRGPWVNNPDTVLVVLKGDVVQDYEVTPYYMLSNISYNLSGNTVSASFHVSEITSGRSIETISLMVNKTVFVDNQSYGHLGDKGWIRQNNVSPGSHSLSLDISGLSPDTGELYARVGLKISGIDQWLFDTNVYKIK
jgi:hypothetical protein